MRGMLGALLMLVGCSSEPIAGAGAASTAEVEALRADVEGLRATIDRMLIEQLRHAGAIAVLREGGAAVKMPHLISRTDAGEIDLGPFVGWDHYWEPRLGAIVPLAMLSFAYRDPDCSGEPFMRTFPAETDYAITPDLRIARRAGLPDPSLVIASILRHGGQCEASSGYGVAFSDTGITPPPLSFGKALGLSIDVR